MTNFTTDVKDSEIYTELIAQIAPKDKNVNKLAMKKEVSDLLFLVWLIWFSLVKFGSVELALVS